MVLLMIYLGAAVMMLLVLAVPVVVWVTVRTVNLLSLLALEIATSLTPDRGPAWLAGNIGFLKGLIYSVLVGLVSALMLLGMYWMTTEIPVTWYWGMGAAVLLGAVTLLRSAMEGMQEPDRRALMLAISSCTCLVLFISLKPPTPHWVSLGKDALRTGECYVQVRVDGAGNVTGVRGDGVNCLGVRFTRNSIQTLDIIAVNQDHLVAKDFFLTDGQTIVIPISKKFLSFYRESFFLRAKHRPAWDN